MSSPLCISTFENLQNWLIHKTRLKYFMWNVRLLPYLLEKQTPKTAGAKISQSWKPIELFRWSNLQKILKITQRPLAIPHCLPATADDLGQHYFSIGFSNNTSFMLSPNKYNSENCINRIKILTSHLRGRRCHLLRRPLVIN